MSNVTIELADQSARKLTKLAKAQGMTLAQYLKSIAEERSNCPMASNSAAQAQLQAFDEWVAGFPAQSGTKLDDSRESIYQGQGE